MHLRNLKIMSISVFQILLLLVSLTLQASGAAPGLAKPNCAEKCGDVTIPFPFGIGAGCFLDDWYQIVCQQNSAVPILKKIGLRVLNISLPNGDVDGMINIRLPVISSSPSCGGDRFGVPVRFEGGPFVFSRTKNVFTFVGCNTLATMSSTESDVVGCRSKCDGTNTSISWNSACSGRDGCCQTTLPLNLQGFSVDFKEEGERQGCKYAFLRSDFTGSYDLRLNKTVPVVLEWGIASNTEYGRKLIEQSETDYPSVCSEGELMLFVQCYCTREYGGNPYLIEGCKGAAPGPPGRGCNETCGKVTIPFPFGMGAGCFLDDWYKIDCQQNTTPTLNKIGVRVLNISLPEVDLPGMINISLPVIYSNASCGGDGRGAAVSLKGSQFVFSRSRNFFTLVGCNTMATVNSTESAVVGCRSKCAGTNFNISKYSACSGRDGCCQTKLPLNLQGFSVDFKEEGGHQGCNYAFLRSDFTGVYDLRSSDTVPVVLVWGIANNTNYALDLIRQDYDAIYNSSYDTPFACTRDSVDSSEMLFTWCYCGRGYGGNPYVIGGCQDINECEDPNMCSGTCVNKQGSYDCVNGRKTAKFILIGVGAGLGALFLCLVLWGLYKYIKKRKEIKLKEKYFKRNGGLLLESELSSAEGNVEKNKLFNSKDLEKATDNFNKDRILGQGGQGTVYKGMLTDGKIVAIKKSKAINEGKVEQFINEVLILSQINHRNVVKLLGCCLETEVPLLVYEFIPNGTLYQYLHDLKEEFRVSWDTRLRVATEIAGALFYLHSAASIPIYHRDIKSTNILLDEKYRAKVADFGTSKSVSLDQTHVTTLVQGTFGYLDPEYFQSSQFTDKSDVYSFGVVLVELLTGQKPISSLREQEGRSLATYFIISMEQNCLFDIVDAQVLKEGKKEDIASVANLAKRCLYLNGRNRPTMKEVAMELERIRKLQNPSGIQQNQEDHEATESYDVAFPSSKSNMVMDVYIVGCAATLT
ncbi:LOW QUALITY PROTEIN: wall-associated receptor kinase-like 3 [Syzygium oleosum]|uniref:LOW QUALITY PROTEIN: wall-associated receptor kinase-like 3 n=1 Tax=Syzygium oleosum TaxID=219896 RepID=UPI0024BB241A|nr:LOW QUALITY PROTEIN: wall-associated receptor kinase-like 3 [Syzygium oleosum]